MCRTYPKLTTMSDERARRAKWDRYYLGMAIYVATASKDPSTKCGAVIVRPNNTIASVGYNGFPRGMPDDPELYADRPTKYSRIIHAEMNAILNAQCSVDGCTLYVTLTPCDRCAVFIAQAGITRVVCQKPTADLLERWSESFNKTEEIFALAGIQIDYEEYHV
jgi:dCMP deaminase